MNKNVILIRYHDEAGVNTRLPDSLNKVQGVLPPLGIAAIAASLEKANIPVEVIDCQGSNISKEEFEKIIKEKNPKIVGIGPMMTPSIEGVYEAAEICKRYGAIVIIGGPHLSIYPKETVMNPNIDFGINGEADFALVDLIKALQYGGEYKNIKGVIWKTKDSIHVSEPCIINDLDKLPIPAYHLLPMDNYNSIIGLTPVSSMMISRGCPYKCRFCYKTPSDIKTRFRSVENAISEMKLLINNCNVNEIMFYDDTLTLKKQYILDLCKAIKENGINVHWEAPTRVNHIDEELVREISRAGCIRLRMGVESGNDRIRKLMRKGVKEQQIFSAFRLCKKYGIETFAYFIVGYISETEETMKETIRFSKKLNPDFAMFTTATPLPNTELFFDAAENKLIDPDYWKKYTELGNNERIPFLVKDADKWTRKAYLKFYFRPGFVLRKLWKMRNLDAAKKYYRAFEGLKDL